MMPISTLTVAVGSSNPSKIRSVQQALQQLLMSSDVELDLKGYSVASGVSHQPMGNDETKRGAKNRADAAYEAFTQEVGTEPHLAFGLEGGLEEHDDELICMAWMVVRGKRSDNILSHTKSEDCGDYKIQDDMSWGLAKTASFVLPPEITRLVKGGMELGDADDHLFSRVKSKHGSGTVGILSGNLIDRSKYYEHALVLAMIPWIRPDVYPVGHDNIQ
jgi:non-canonical (house-cleaning) NTP pyrophosphatase